MRAVVFGYSNVGDRCLRVLQARGVEVPLVVTHRDHPGETLWFARVADTAAEFGLPTVYVEDLSAGALRDAVAAVRPGAIFSFYFRSMIPLDVLALAPAGAFNLHGSLLPKYRGRAPTNWAVLHGETETGATLHEMVAKPDAGAIVDRSAVPILPDDTARQVFDKVTVAAEQVLWRSLPAIVAGRAPRLANDLAAGSYFGGRKPEDGRIDWARPAVQVYNLIRAVAPPYPGAFTDVAGKRLVVAAARLAGPAIPANAGDASDATDTRDAAETRDAAFQQPRADRPAQPSRLGLQSSAGRIVGACGDGGLIDIRLLTCDGDAVDAARLAGLLAAQPSA